MGLIEEKLEFFINGVASLCIAQLAVLLWLLSSKVLTFQESFVSGLTTAMSLVLIVLTFLIRQFLLDLINLKSIKKLLKLIVVCKRYLKNA